MLLALRNTLALIAVPVLARCGDRGCAWADTVADWAGWEWIDLPEEPAR